MDIFKSSTAGVPVFYLVDTPGFDDTLKSDIEILMDVAGWLNKAYKAKIPLTGIIYLHRINDVRVGGTGMKTCGHSSSFAVQIFFLRLSLQSPFGHWSHKRLAMPAKSNSKRMTSSGDQ